MLKNKIISIILCFSIVFVSIFVVNVQQAKAWPVSISAANILPEGVSAAGTIGKWAWDIAGKLADTLGKIGAVAAKIAALMVVQKITQAIIGDGGGSGVVSDWNKYLYVSPQQRAMAQMNSFFNTASRGRLSSLNYEGVGPNYDIYLASQAKQAINGQTFVTNLQDVVSDPNQIFASGNMKGMMAYMKCPNNVACYTLTAQSQYTNELAKATKIAEMEQANGFLPVKKNGKITQPASLAASALTQVDQLGTQLIMNADFQKDGGAAFGQIAAGAGISIASRALNYSIASSDGKAAIRNKNDQFPFSLAYSGNSGIGVNAGGVNVSTGVGAVASQVQIGNTCATAGGTVDGGGATVTIQGRKYDCATKTEVSGTGPAVTGTTPSVTAQ